MTITLEEITVREAKLREEIAERERLLAAYELIRAHGEKSFPLAGDAFAGRDQPPAAHPEPAAPPILPAPAVPAVPAVNLEALAKGYGGGIRVVTWAIRQMTGDFTVHHIAAALRDAGCPMRVRQVSIVLNRMKNERKIEEVSTGRGQTPSVFRATDVIHARPLELAARHRKIRPPRRFIFQSSAWSRQN